MQNNSKSFKIENKNGDKKTSEPDIYFENIALC